MKASAMRTSLRSSVEASTSTFLGKPIRFAVTAVVSLLLLWYALVGAGFTGLSGISADVTADRLTTQAAFRGISPYLDLGELSNALGIAYVPAGEEELGEAERVAPRLPGAFLVLAPILAVPPDLVFSASLAFNAMALLTLGVLLAVRLRLPAEAGLLAAPFLVLTGPVASTFEWGSQSLFIVLLVVGAWGLAHRSDGAWSGALLGVAGVLKLYPLLFLLPFLRWKGLRAILSAGASFLFLNLWGLALPGVGLREAFVGLASAGASWVGFGGNASLAGRASEWGLPWPEAVLTGLAISMALLALLWWRTSSFDHFFLGIAPIALLAVPLSWDHYGLVLFPLAFWLALRAYGQHPALWWMLGMWVVCDLLARPIRAAISPQDPDLAELLAFVSRLALLMAALSFSEREVSAGERLTQWEVPELPQ